MTDKRIKFSDIREAFDFVSFGGEAMEHEAYLCLDTGHIYWYSDYADNEEEPLPDDIGDMEKYAAIPHKNDLDLGKPLVSRFTEEHMPEDYETVQTIFSGRGAYARFKDLLDARGMLKEWYEYENTATDEALFEWCEENDIEISR
uniref:Uncharacterized protein n=1 Tax=Candidatus Kentrum sp. FW TaxID=2126338 RepID=A0A450S7P6_9GAMM|nr:MAG: Uncharacterised protein family (UPF0158) [Candidatus Kentron sp. FW]